MTCPSDLGRSKTSETYRKRHLFGEMYGIASFAESDKEVLLRLPGLLRVRALWVH